MRKRPLLARSGQGDLLVALPRDQPHLPVPGPPPIRTRLRVQTGEEISKGRTTVGLAGSNRRAACPLKVRAEGQFIFNTIRQRLDSALQGLGLAHMPEDVAAPCIATGELVRS